MTEPRRDNPHGGRWRGVENTVTRIAARAGLIPHSWVLETIGRRTGRTRRNPVVVVPWEGRRWLVAPYGVVGWVHNARAAGQVRLSRRMTTHEVRVREVDADEAGPVLARYVELAKVTRPWFAAGPGDPPERFAAEAGAHPTFELVAAGP